MKSVLIAILITVIVMVLIELVVIIKLKNKFFDFSTVFKKNFCNDITTPEICKFFDEDISSTDIVNFTNGKQSDEEFAKNGALILSKFLNSIDKNQLKDLDSVNHVKIFWVEDPQLPIGIIINRNIVVFRGTKTYNDLKKDITFEQVNIDGLYMVHKGFYELYRSIKDDILKNLDFSQDIYVVGHSLGCGLSILLTYDLVYKNINVNTLLVAPPKVGNQDFADYIDKNKKNRVVSIINLADLVPAFPFSYMVYEEKSYQYSHCGNILSFNQLGKSISDCHSVYTYFTFLYNIQNSKKE
jgi:hypothetical protein